MSFTLQLTLCYVITIFPLQRERMFQTLFRHLYPFHAASAYLPENVRTAWHSGYPNTFWTLYTWDLDMEISSKQCLDNFWKPRHWTLIQNQDTCPDQCVFACILMLPAWGYIPNPTVTNATYKLKFTGKKVHKLIYNANYDNYSHGTKWYHILSWLYISLAKYQERR